MTEPADPWRDPAFLRDVQYKSDANLAARQSIYSYQHPRIDLQALVVDLAAVEPGETVADVGCGNGRYLAELARRGLAGLIIGADHLRELREIVAAASGNDRWKRRERLTLDVGEAMARSCFSTVTRHDFVGQLRLPVKEPVADYLRSMSLTQAADDPECYVAAVLSRLSAGPGAPFTITTHAGCLICEV